MICTNRFRFLTTTKDGGPDSTVWAHWLIAWKALFSVGLLRFEGKSREAFHTHAFDAVSWVLRGRLKEDQQYEHGGWIIRWHAPSWRPIVTRRDCCHKVDSDGTTWVLTFRGPWADTWREYLQREGRWRTLTHGRVEL